jgi:SHS family lactate transporter-like MFS transporter
MAFAALKGWPAAHKHVVTAAYLGWTLDALDFFLLVFVLKDVAAEFATTVTTVTVAVTLTLACRPIGAFIFGRLADRFGRRPILMLDIAVYSLLSFSTAFVPNLTLFLIVRALFGIGMGGVWGIGASLSMETVRPQARGVASGILTSGYCSGYILASIVFGVLYVHIGWRGMFMVALVPAMLLILYVWAKVPESPLYDKAVAHKGGTFTVLRQHWKLVLYAVIMMGCFNFYSHGTGDLYPLFLQREHGLKPAQVGQIAILYNIGGVLGCWLFGPVSQHLGRRKTMIVAALMGVPVIYFWAFSPYVPVLTVGAILINFFVQGCWSIMPAHLNELSPAGARGTFPGTMYQLGNLLASSNLTLQAIIAEKYSYGIALASVALLATIAIIGMILIGPEAHNAEMKKAG